MGELVKMDDWTGTNTFELDLLGQLKKVTDHKGKTVEYTYDAVGLQTAIKYPDGSAVANTFDAVGNLLSVKDAENQTSSYVYDDAGRVTRLTLPNGWVEDYTYDAEGNLLKTMDTDPNKYYGDPTTKKFEYTYDADGNVTREYKRDSGEENLNSTVDYTYDALNRITSAKTVGEKNAVTYTYDSLGNMVQEDQKGVYWNRWEYNNLNEMTAKEVCNYISGITRENNFGYTYDGRGNLVQERKICAPLPDGTSGDIISGAYVYDETNRMVQGRNEQGEASLYTFNGLGVRVGTEVIVEDNDYGYTDFHCETPSIETGLVTPEVVKTDYIIDYTRLNIDQRDLMKSELGGYDYRYVYGNDKISLKVTSEGTDWWGQSIKKNILKQFYHQDRLGSTVNMSDGYGYTQEYADYGPWGEFVPDTTEDSITIDGGFRQLWPQLSYTGHEYDMVLGQFYAKARMYSAENKRFNAVDPVKGQIIDPLSLVQYLYVVDNSLRWVDPLGKYYIFKTGNESYYAVAEDYDTSFAQYLIDQIPVIGGMANTALNAWEEKYAVGGNSMSEGHVIQQLLGNTYDEFVDKGLEIAGDVILEGGGAIVGVVTGPYKFIHGRGALSVASIDSYVFSLFEEINLIPKGSTIDATETVMEKAYEYVLSKKSTFLQPLYNTLYRGITGVEYVGVPIWNIISELYDAEQAGKSESQIQKIKNKYYSRINCSGLYSKDWGEQVVGYDYAGNYVNTSAYGFAIENYKVLYGATFTEARKCLETRCFRAFSVSNVLLMPRLQ